MRRLKGFFAFTPSAPRFGIAARSAVSIGLSVLIAWAAGHASAGLIAAIGAFTALYGSDRPYRQRALLLAGVALAFTIVVTLGVATQHMPWAAVPLVAIVAAGGTYLCNALKIGPGAYMFALAAAVATALPQAKFPGATIELAVLLGGVLSWIVHMLGVFFDRRGPEKAVVIQASRAVADFARNDDAARASHTRHAAALALHEAWNTLVSFQPRGGRADAMLGNLRARTRALHMLFADCILGGDAGLAERAQTLGDLARPVADLPPIDSRDDLPLGQPSLRSAIMGNLVWGLPALTAAARVGLAVIPTGLIGLIFGVSRAYWAMAAAVLVLHQGFDWARTVGRGLARTLGTFIGLGLAFLIILLHPASLWLAPILMALQFGTEMIVTRNYVLAAILITASAITMATGGQPVPHLGALLWSRAFDTAIGCAVGLAVFWATARWVPRRSVRREMLRALVAARHTASLLAQGEVTDSAARRARQHLQVAIFRLGNAYETRRTMFLVDHHATEALWPAVAAAERIGYRTLALAWALEAGRGDAPSHRDDAARMALALATVSDEVTGQRIDHRSIDRDQTLVDDLSTIAEPLTPSS